VLRFEWNALRKGDHLLVHDPRTTEMTLTEGVVSGVDRHGVGIRVFGHNGDTAVLWPSHLAVHGHPRDPSEACWRCQKLAERALSRLDEPTITDVVEVDDAPRAEPAPSLSDPT
jgi:hypothetical protein